MRHAIARAIFACLHILLTLALPASGRRRKQATAPVPPPPYVSPWSRPWTGPTKEEAAEFFRRQAEADAVRQVLAEREHTLQDPAEHARQQERQRAAAYATLGIDYPYTYPGAPFPADAFRTSA